MVSTVQARLHALPTVDIDKRWWAMRGTAVDGTRGRGAVREPGGRARALTVAVVAAALLALPACGSGSDEATTTTAGGDTATTTTAAGGSGTAKAPEGWPADVPLPPDAENITSTGTLEIGSGSGIDATLTTSGSADELVEYFQTTLAAEGWTVSPDVQDIAGAKALEATKSAENRTVKVVVTDVAGRTGANINVITIK